ncbi:Arm DNA-binding domain-containing protein [Bordetella holmesii]|uniref:PF12167 domain protein n=2 Tax=Bordetella holmesii TaxID=35814 RepID=A0A158M7N7_9BORD|nr:DUF3596 domain-containing protein [Bordetella holmesii]AHV91797.1 hypothetical protein D560_3552 [Bordetella holmesii ATCC 51541]AIT28164.1 hypothetical protein D558_3524 [Bordetella holmesii 44057]EWM40949.1 hypothetical protein D555_3594 [Bordetella holmesii 35009]EWM43203.1 hypothetical protein D556_3523 [Bordetella holmesii 41130]EWM44841.1 hypothetical protein D557_2830 [Bordetella holmesii 70147]
MTAPFEGVRPASESSIEIGFVFEGRHCVQRLRLKPTAANLKKAAIRRAEILEAIARGDYRLPAS